MFWRGCCQDPTVPGAGPTHPAQVCLCFHIMRAYGAQVTYLSYCMEGWGLPGAVPRPTLWHRCAGRTWVSLAAPSSSSSSPFPLLLAYCRELNMEPLKIFLFQNIFCISYNRYYNDSMHLLKIYGFRLLLVISNSCYI